MVLYLGGVVEPPLGESQVFFQQQREAFEKLANQLIPTVTTHQDPRSLTYISVLYQTR